MHADTENNPHAIRESFVPEGLDNELRDMASGGKLLGIRRTRLDLVQDWLDQGLTAEDICRRLTAFNRDVILAVLKVHAEIYPWLEQCTFLEFGSGGRDEQVVSSDQDNGLLMHVEPDPDELADATQQIVMALDGVGLSLCEGGVMISNAEWRGTYDSWLGRLTDWLSNPVENGPWQSGLILDFTAIYGPKEEARLLREHLWEYVRTKPLILSLLTRELIEYQLPLTMFGAFVTEKKGIWQGHLNIKNSVLAHVTNGARILALKYDLGGPNTCDRIRAMAEAGHVSPKHGAALLDAWDYLQRKRLVMGLACEEQGIPAHNYVNPALMGREEKLRLKAAIQAAEKLVHLVQAGSGL